MSEETEAIRQDIAAVRESMSDKLEQIESKVRDTVDTTMDKVRDTVDTTVDSVRDTVDTTVDKVSRAFDIKQQVSDHPWAALGIAAVTGYVLGSIGGSSSSTSVARSDQQSRSYAYDSDDRSTSRGYDQHQAESRFSQSSDFIKDISNEFGDELNLITTAAIAATMDLLRDTVKAKLPQFGQEYAKRRDESHRDESHDDTPAKEYAVGAPREHTDTSHRSTTADPGRPVYRHETIS